MKRIEKPPSVIIDPDRIRLINGNVSEKKEGPH